MGGIDPRSSQAEGFEVNGEEELIKLSQETFFHVF
jgi:hypothetical protein